MLEANPQTPKLPLILTIILMVKWSIKMQSGPQSYFCRLLQKWEVNHGYWYEVILMGTPCNLCTFLLHKVANLSI